jgi:hypothetical protein
MVYNTSFFLYSKLYTISGVHPILRHTQTMQNCMFGLDAKTSIHEFVTSCQWRFFTDSISSFHNIPWISMDILSEHDCVLVPSTWFSSLCMFVQLVPRPGLLLSTHVAAAAAKGMKFMAPSGSTQGGLRFQRWHGPASRVHRPPHPIWYGGLPPMGGIHRHMHIYTYIYMYTYIYTYKYMAPTLGNYSRGACHIRNNWFGINSFRAYF